MSTTVGPKGTRKKGEFIGQQFVVRSNLPTVSVHHGVVNFRRKPDGPAPDSIALNMAASGCKKRIKSLESSGGFSDGTLDHIARRGHVMQESDGFSNRHVCDIVVVRRNCVLNFC